MHVAYQLDRPHGAHVPNNKRAIRVERMFNPSDYSLVGRWQALGGYPSFPWRERPLRPRCHRRIDDDKEATGPWCGVAFSCQNPEGLTGSHCLFVVHVENCVAINESIQRRWYPDTAFGLYGSETE